MPYVIRVLTSLEDQAKLEAFLDRHIETSMIPRSNVARVGLVDGGERYQGTYVAAFDGDAICGMAAHYWNDNLVVQAPDALAEVVREAVARSGRAVASIMGPHAQVVAARAALGFENRRAIADGLEQLYGLALEALVVPAMLSEGRLACRAPRDDELALLLEWRVQFCVESLGESDTPEMRDRCRGFLETMHARREHWIAHDEGRLLAYSAFNATAGPVVQIGGVFTPPELRSCGYARAVVAGSLVEARRNAATRAVLFTAHANLAAQRCYESLGFRWIGEFGLLRFFEA
jgi:predicted GNAT family acetyltransferase